MSVQQVNPFSNFKTGFNNTNTAAPNATAKTAPNAAHSAENTAQDTNKQAAIGSIAALAILAAGTVIAVKKHKVPDEMRKSLDDFNFKTTDGTVNSLAQSAQKQIDETAEEIQKIPDEIKTALESYKDTGETANSLVQSAQKQIGEITENVQKQIEEAAEQARRIKENAQKLFNEATELFKEGGKTSSDGTPLRTITGFDAGEIMEEFDRNGKIIRRFIFENDTLKSVQEGYEKLADGTSKYAKELTFVNGKPFWYKEGVEELADGTSKYAKELTFVNGKPNLYKEGAKYNALKTDEPEEVGKQYALTKKGWQEVTE